MATSAVTEEKPLAVQQDAPLKADLPATTTAVVKKTRKPRIDCIDGCRFALVFPIIVGHFVKFGTKNQILLKLLTQENVFVGGFFIISGYVAGYVSTKIGERDCEREKLANPELFFWQKVMSYYPLHFLISTLFAPMFVVVDRWRKVPATTTAFHAVLNYTLGQAWFPSAAEIWNPPTWFLSALTFVNLALPTIVLPPMSQLSKDGLRKLLWGLGGLSIVQKLSYSQAWQFRCKGAYKTRVSSPHLWNGPDSTPHLGFGGGDDGYGCCPRGDVGQPRGAEDSPFHASPAPLRRGPRIHVPLRTTRRLNLNDALVRSTLFVPLYLRFLQSMHRDCLTSNPTMITRFFGSSTMGKLGALAFPMFIVHGPIGQLFYKRDVATKLFGGVVERRFFPVYLAVVMLVSHLINEGFVKNQTVINFSSRVAKFLAEKTAGMLRDQAPQEAKSGEAKVSTSRKKAPVGCVSA
eukprot:CAMPEP_0206576176 /NCGR_PEP_ID=MMETSP0325_2-20121206/30582_1 /ASSEMBLY_ACC=CAM_ASM_000347 /TAXON_ID=2866 /ORGANISM="Crypthecodinium cohnii, Strain Seligo" /LENGTH=462 /DNA_ID=CAMNT_0054081315 /DNA_START=30 /DNA_END=1419 /DNA_ORIENTATION=+